MSPMQAESVDTAEKTDKELKNKTKEVPTLGSKCCEKNMTAMVL